MIKFNGINLKYGCGDYFVFGYDNGDGSGNKIVIKFFINNYGSGYGDGKFFGNFFGNGCSYNPKLLKEEFQKYD